MTTAKNILTKRLRRSLRKICMADIADFRSLGESVDNNEGDLIYIDRGHNLLAVGHLDWVSWTQCSVHSSTVTCGQLDDRLGVWVLMQLLPALGYGNYDILLTDNEESANSTAQFFQPPEGKTYNWMFEFDRRGTDVVMYDYRDDTMKELVKNHGFDVGWGSYTDICELQDIGCKGFNFGTGYHEAHTNYSYADLNDTVAMAKAFVDFANTYENIHFPHVASSTFERGNRWGSYYDPHGSSGYTSGNSMTACTSCGRSTDIVWDYCAWCGEEIGARHYSSITEEGYENYYGSPGKKWSDKWSNR